MRAAATAEQVPDEFERFEAVLRDLATTEGRLLTSAGVLVVALLVGLVVFPLLVRATSRLLRGQLLPKGMVEIVDSLNGYLPTTVSHAVLRSLQLGVALVAVVALLVTWGMVPTAVTVVSVLWVSLPFAGQVVLSGLVLIFAYIAVDVLDRTVRGFSSEAQQVTDQQEEILLRMGHLGILLVVVSGLLTLWGLDLSGLLLGAGVLGVVLGLAARQTVGAMIAGFVLMFTQPFTIGDWIEIDGHEGNVTKITIMHTEIREFDGELVVIPNDVVAGQAMRNLSHQDILRLETEVGVGYEVDPAHAERVAIEAIEDLDAVADTPPPETATVAFGDSAVVLRLLYWIEDPTPADRRHATQAVIHAVKQRFETEGIEIPFPQRDLSLSGWPDDEGRHPADPPDEVN